MFINYDAIQEFQMMYYINEQELLDNNTDRKIAEYIATKEAIEMTEEK